MNPPPTGLDADLLAEFAAAARIGYADLLAALAVATHPSAGPAADPVTAAARLADCWHTACALAAPGDQLADRFPLADPGSLAVLDGLLALAAYTTGSSDRAERVGQVVHALSKAARASDSPADGSFGPG